MSIYSIMLWSNLSRFSLNDTTENQINDIFPYHNMVVPPRTSRTEKKQTRNSKDPLNDISLFLLGISKFPRQFWNVREYTILLLLLINKNETLYLLNTQKRHALNLDCRHLQRKLSFCFHANCRQHNVMDIQYYVAMDVGDVITY